MMGSIADYLETLSDDPSSLMLSALVFVLVFAVVAIAGLHFLNENRPPDRAGPRPSDHISNSASDGVAETDVGPHSLGRLSASPETAVVDEVPRIGSRVRDPRVEPRHVMGAIHRVLSALILGFLVVATVASYLASSPHDGSLLFPAVLVVVTLITASYLAKWRQRFGSPKADAALRSEFRSNIEASLAEKLTRALVEKTPIHFAIGAPEVHSMLRETVDRAQALAAEGKSIDEICRLIEPEYAGWSAPHQQAYQALMRSVIEHG